MPSDLLVSTQTTAGYNRGLEKATAGMKLGVNKSMNLGMKPIGVRRRSLEDQYIDFSFLKSSSQETSDWKGRRKVNFH